MDRPVRSSRHRAVGWAAVAAVTAVVVAACSPGLSPGAQGLPSDIKDVMESDAIIKDRLNQTAQVFNPGGPAEFAKSIEEQRGILANSAKELGMPEKR